MHTYTFLLVDEKDRPVTPTLTWTAKGVHLDQALNKRPCEIPGVGIVRVTAQYPSKDMTFHYSWSSRNDLIRPDSDYSRQSKASRQVRKRRKLAGMSQADLAVCCQQIDDEYFGTEFTTWNQVKISRLESGAQVLKVGHVRVLAQALGCTLADFC